MVRGGEEAGEGQRKTDSTGHGQVSSAPERRRKCQDRPLALVICRL